MRMVADWDSPSDDYGVSKPASIASLREAQAPAPVFTARLQRLVDKTRTELRDGFSPSLLVLS